MSDARLDGLLDGLLAGLRPLVAELVAEELERRLGHLDDASSQYLTVEQAAAYIGSERQRIYDLTSDGRLRRYRDGTRLLLRRDELDDYLADGGRSQTSRHRP